MKLRVLPCLLLCLLLLSGCTAQAEPVEATFFAMDKIGRASCRERVFRAV